MSPRMGIKNSRTLVAIVVVAFAMLAFVPAALASDSSTASGGVAGQVNSKIQQGGDASGSGTATAKGSLPFTGLDLGLIVAGGAMLLLIGGTLRRFTRDGVDA